MEVRDDTTPSDIIGAFGLKPSEIRVERIGAGHIHQTYKLIGKSSYILQRVNKNVFKQPEIISANLQLASDYLSKNSPNYLFLRGILSSDKTENVFDKQGFPWRMFPYVQNTITINKVETPEEAFSAASQFARLTYLLNKIEVHKFKETIPRFHDLALRYRQFEDALSQSTQDRRQESISCIDDCKSFYPLVETYDQLVKSGSLPLRIMHNDAKINNILFDETSRKAVCVIDLDTLMPGYFIYDLGDMVRTFVNEVDEEEKDFSKIKFRQEIYDALLAGYLSQMEVVMSLEEIKAIPFAGRMMTYIMALRFLTDYLNGDRYFHTAYSGQNLVRAGNQLGFLKKLELALSV